MKNKSVLNSPRTIEIKNRKRKILQKKIIIFSVIFLVSFIGLSFLSKWSELNITKFEYTGNKIVDSSDIEKIVLENISGRYVWLFPKTNFALYPKGNIRKDLVEKFKRFKEININLKDLNTLEINVVEREGEYMWCGDLLPEDLSQIEGRKCYFMDNTGYIFDEAPYFSGEIYFRFYGILSENSENPVNSVFMPENFPRIAKLKDMLEAIDLKPIAFLLKEDGDIEFYLSPKGTLTKPKIILKLNSDFDKIIENLHASIQTEPLYSDLKNKYDSLLYIDMRFGNKVYYKFE